MVDHLEEPKLPCWQEADPPESVRSIDYELDHAIVVDPVPPQCDDRNAIDRAPHHVRESLLHNKKPLSELPHADATDELLWKPV